MDYPKDVVELVTNNLEINKTIVEIQLNGRDLMLDFLHMFEMNLKNGFQQPIAFIDEAHGCFFPEVLSTQDEESYIFKHEGMKLHIDIKVNVIDESKLRECRGESRALVEEAQVKVVNRKDKMNYAYVGELGLDAHSESVHGKLDLDFVQELFLNGMISFGSTNFEIIDTYRYSGASLQARFELFRTQAKITKEFHEDANVRYAWLPFSEGELSKMVKLGLGHCALSTTKCTYGAGVLLADVTCPYASARYCDIDKNGVRHLVLYRVIMGNMEPIRPDIAPDTTQFQPSSPEYDNGVDSIQCPRYYIVWSMNINTHIYPEFIVSFKVSRDFEGHFCGIVGKNDVYGANSYGANSTSHSFGDKLQSSSSVESGITAIRIASSLKIPKSPWLPFPMLIGALSDKVSSSDMSLIRAYHELYKAKQISRDDFVKELRLIIGDTIPSNRELEASNQNEG
ncbi:inactive poly [ADP-ribose] polymerase RCD1-like [Lotus japonicus]|uniref:inactive poly [ADP-ribose] polymerase RCD1-like n=1 Tax=Lotus japonicus TaxID=34305 RepID=UPI00258FFC66|nr:inactive poly [ADP-ribose] polymerase RCD1-like [Lotus japonicus]